jgi:hypothetical protein
VSPHCIHVAAHDSGNSYLVICRWLADLLSQAVSLERSDQNEKKFVEIFNNKHNENHSDNNTSNIVPIFKSTGTVFEQRLLALTVINDPLLGHIGIYRSTVGKSSSTSVTAVNISVLISSLFQEQRLVVIFYNIIISDS